MKEEKGICPTVYGPKRSRRQGLSLGINLGDPEIKCCTWSCIYCQCGFGRKMDGTPRYPSRHDVLTFLVRAIANNPEIDSVTFAGNSEPTAYPEFLHLVEDIIELRKREGGKWIFNCLTNGSELDKENVRTACDRLDEAWIKLDCADDELFAKLNRPLARVGNVQNLLERIKKLEKPRIQTLLWNDESERKLGNFTKENLDKLIKAYEYVRPLQIHITTVQRDPATPGIIPVSEGDLNVFAARVRELGLEVVVFP